MKPRTLSLALVVGLFALGLWLALRPGGQVARKAGTGPGSALVSPAVETVAPRAEDRAPASSPVSANATPGVTAPKPSVGVAAVPVYAPGVSVPPEESTAPTVAGGDAVARPRDAQIDVGKVRVMLRDYHTLAGENPVGTNAEIMSALMGGNARQAMLGPPEGISLNSKGELIDQWNTPYFFHQLSKDVMEVRSAGPDKVMWTQDDIVTK